MGVSRALRRHHREWEKNYRLRCIHCDWFPPEDLTVGVVRAHFETEHGTEKVQLVLVWVGEGPDPNAQG